MRCGLTKTVALVLLGSILLSCTSTTSILPKTHYIEDQTEPVRLGISQEGPDLTVTLETVIAPGSPGSWHKDPKWDEYVLSFGSRAQETVEVTAVYLVDPRGVFIEPESDMKTLQAKTEALLKEYRAILPNVVLGGALLLSQTVMLGGALAAAAPVAIVAAPAYLIWRRRAAKRDAATVEEEFAERRLPKPLLLAKVGTIAGRKFFPIVPSPRALVVRYRAAGEEREDSLDLAVLKDLHLDTTNES